MPKNDSDSGNIAPSFGDAVSKYSALFNFNDSNDQSKIAEEERRGRQRSAAQITNDYYDFSSDMYERGWSKHFHYTPFAPNESIEQAQAFYAHQLAWRTGLRKDMKVLDVGCGIGSPAREIARFIGCEIVGVSINQNQINRAIELAAQEGLSHLCTFIKADFLNLPFAPHSFDAAYAIEATVHAPEYAQVYAQISRVLKPGAPFGLAEWVLTPEFDPTNSKHIAIRNHIEYGNAITNLEKVDVARTGLLSTGFEISQEENYAEHWKTTLRYPHLDRTFHREPSPSLKSSHALSHEDRFTTSPVLIPYFSSTRRAPPPTRPCHPLPSTLSSLPRAWYYPLQGNSKLAKTKEDKHIANMMKPRLRKLSYTLVWTLEKMRLYPKGAYDVVNTIGVCVDGVVEGALEGIFSPGWWFICRKIGEPEFKEDWVVSTAEGLEKRVVNEVDGQANNEGGGKNYQP